MSIFWKPTGHDESESWALQRRGYDLGTITSQSETVAPLPSTKQVSDMWQQHKPVLLKAWVLDTLAAQRVHIEARELLVMAILQGNIPSESIVAGPWQERFSLLGSSDESHDPQAIEKIFFAALQHKEEHDNLWCKASWLSFYDDDASLRFRFSFGMEGFEDVAADPARQQSAADLCAALFPESAAIEKNESLNDLMQTILGTAASYVERIVYFNAPNGGAQMHHDVERGHAGVVYAQLTGKTFWLALSKPLLVEEICNYHKTQDNLAERLFSDPSMQAAFKQLLADQHALRAYLNQEDHELLEVLMDQHGDFVRHMIQQGHGFIVHAGDVLLLPQQDLETCVWHTVFCLGDEMGQALSFAIRGRA